MQHASLHSVQGMNPDTVLFQQLQACHMRLSFHWPTSSCQLKLQSSAPFSGRDFSTLVRLNASDGSVLRQWGSAGSGNCQFGYFSVAVDDAGNVLVSNRDRKCWFAWHEGTREGTSTCWPLHSCALASGLGLMLQNLITSHQNSLGSVCCFPTLHVYVCMCLALTATHFAAHLHPLPMARSVTQTKRRSR